MEGQTSDRLAIFNTSHTPLVVPASAMGNAGTQKLQKSAPNGVTSPTTRVAVGAVDDCPLPQVGRWKVRCSNARVRAISPTVHSNRRLIPSASSVPLSCLMPAEPQTTASCRLLFESRATYRAVATSSNVALPSPLSRAMTVSNTLQWQHTHTVSKKRDIRDRALHLE